MATRFDANSTDGQGVMRLEYFWKTKRWYKRMLVCMLECCMVDAFRAYEYVLGPLETNDFWNEGGDGSGSRIVKFTTMVIDSILKRVRDDDFTPQTTRTNESMCYLELIDTRTVSKPGAKGEGKRTYPYKLACVQCKRAKRRPSGSNRCYRSIWRCAKHPECVLCPAKDRTCFAEHCDLYIDGSPGE